MVALSETPLILIVDAEAVNCRLFEAKLTRHHEFRVVCATTGHAASQLATQESFDVLLWDMRLRETLSLLPRIRAFCPHSALLLMTTDDRPALSLTLQRLDIADILIKPLNLDTLLQKVRYAVANPLERSATTLLEIVSVGQKVVLRRETGTCTTRVVSVTLDSFSVVAPPRVTAPADFTPGAFIRISLPADNAIYTFETTIEERMDLPVPQWRIALPELIKREQRRQYVRTPLHIPIVLNPQPPLDTFDPIHAVIKDMSLGGFAVVSVQDVAPGTEVTFDLQQSGTENFVGFGRVLRSVPRTPPTDDTVPKYEIAVEFTSLPLIARRRLSTLLEKSEG